MRARLVLMPDDGELPRDQVIVAEVVEVRWEDADGNPAVAAIPATYLESMTNMGAERRMGRQAVGWPLLVYARREGGVENASPGG